MKLNRNTTNATQKAAQVKKERRLELQLYIAQKVIPDFCKNENCPGALDCEKDIFKECTSYNDLAGTLNTLGIETLSGTKGNWKAEMVKNLFKDFR